MLPIGTFVTIKGTDRYVIIDGKLYYMPKMGTITGYMYEQSQLYYEVDGRYYLPEQVATE